MSIFKKLFAQGGFNVHQEIIKKTTDEDRMAKFERLERRRIENRLTHLSRHSAPEKPVARVNNPALWFPVRL